MLFIGIIAAGYFILILEGMWASIKTANFPKDPDTDWWKND